MFEKYYLVKLITIFLQVLWINGILPQKLYDDIWIIKQEDSAFQCRTSYLFLFFNIYIQTSLSLTQCCLEGSILDLWMCNRSNGISITRSNRVTEYPFPWSNGATEYQLRSNGISLLRGNILSRTEDISYSLPVTYHITTYWNTIFKIVSITI